MAVLINYEQFVFCMNGNCSKCTIYDVHASSLGVCQV